MLCLAVTPINTVIGWRGVVRVKRTLGMYAFMYALIHVLILVGWDYSFNFNYLWGDFSGKSYIWVGLAGFLILTVLAATGFHWAMRWLGKNWKRIHRLVYAAGVLVILHFAWAVKGDIFRLQGNIRQPLTYGLIVILLLGLRIPPLARGIKRLRGNLSRWFRHHDPRSWMVQFRRSNPAESGAPHSS